MLHRGGWRRIPRIVKPIIAPAIIATIKPVAEGVKESKQEIAAVVEKIKSEAKSAKRTHPAHKLPKPIGSLKKCQPSSNKKYRCLRKKDTSKDGADTNKVLQAKVWDFYHKIWWKWYFKFYCISMTFLLIQFFQYHSLPNWLIWNFLWWMIKWATIFSW